MSLDGYPDERRPPASADTQRFRDLVIKVREEGGNFAFYRDDQSAMLWAKVELPIAVPGIYSPAVGVASVREDAEDQDPHAREAAAVEAYRLAKTKIMMLTPVGKFELVGGDETFLKELGIGTADDPIRQA